MLIFTCAKSNVEILVGYLECNSSKETRINAVSANGAIQSSIGSFGNVVPPLVSTKTLPFVSH